MDDNKNETTDSAAEVVEKKTVRKTTKAISEDAVDTIAAQGSVLFMTSAGGSWTTPSGVTFSKTKPYQLVPAEEIEPLLSSGRFRRAEALEVKEFYNIEL